MWVAIGVSVAGTALSVAGQVSAANAKAGQSRVAGMAAMSEGALDQAMRDSEARSIRQQAAAEADNIKRSAMLMRGQIAVAQSGSGVMIGEGSAQAAMDQLETLSSADALAALYSGVNKAVSTRASGRYAEQAGYQKNKAWNQAAAGYESQAGWAVAGGIAQVAGSVAGAYGGGTAGTAGSSGPNLGTPQAGV